MDDFKTIRFRTRTADRYKRFSKKISVTYSGTLDMIMDFFEWHEFYPTDRFGKKIIEEILKNRERMDTSIKRNEATIAIIKNIERETDLPVKALLETLFEGVDNESDDALMQEDIVPIEKKEDTSHVPRIRFERLESNMKEVQRKFLDILERIEPFKNRFGKDHFKLDISIQELSKLKQRIKDI